MNVLTRYLLRAHVGPFFFAFFTLTGVILINTLAKEMANLAGKGLPLKDILEFFVLSLPANIALTLPMAVLVAVLHTFSTLAMENEITALRANGLDLRRVAMPLVVTAAFMAGGMVWFNDQVLTAANYRWRILMTDVAQARPLLALREQTINPIRSQGGLTPYYLEARELNTATGQMRGVSIYDVSDNNITRTIHADSGRMVINASGSDLMLTLFDGEMREVDFGELTNFQEYSFDRQVMRLADVSGQLQRTAESSYRTDRDMTVTMMAARIDSARVELEQLRRIAAGEEEPPSASSAAGRVGGVDAGTVEETVAAAAAAIAAGHTDLPSDEDADPVTADTAGAAEVGDAMGTGSTALDSVTTAGDDSVTQATDPDSTAAASPAGAASSTDTAATTLLASAGGALRDFRPGGQNPRDYAAARARNLEAQIRELQVEMQKKFSIAVATLVFVLIGVPIALRFPRGGIGMVIAVSLAIFGIYYVGLIGGETLANKGYMPPALSMWLTNIVFGILGLIGFMRLGRELGTTRGGGLPELLPGFLRRLRRSRA